MQVGKTIWMDIPADIIAIYRSSIAKLKVTGQFGPKTLRYCDSLAQEIDTDLTNNFGTSVEMSVRRSITIAEMSV